MMNQTLNPFEKLLVDLVRQKIDFMTVGGMACVMNGHVRATEDVDILIRRSPENIQRVIDCLSHYGEGFAKELQVADFSDEEGAVRIIEDFPIDIFVVMGGRHFEDLLPFCAYEQIADVGIPYLRAEGLIALKTGSVREKDRLDVIHLTNIINRQDE